METYRTMYHLTSADAWEKHIRHEGLIPYPTPCLNNNLTKTKKAIFLFSKDDADIFSKFFLWKRIGCEEFGVGVVLCCQVRPADLLTMRVQSERGETCEFPLTLGFDGRTVCVVPVDASPEPIPPEMITPLYEIGVVISPYPEARR
jgi:hypothetical protein